MTKNSWWRVEVSAVVIDRYSRPIFIDGEEVPQRLYVMDEKVYVGEWNQERARKEAEKRIRQNYNDEDFVDIKFTNTKPVDQSEVPKYFRDSLLKLDQLLILLKRK